MRLKLKWKTCPMTQTQTHKPALFHNKIVRLITGTFPTKRAQERNLQYEYGIIKKKKKQTRL